ncbi:MAG: hypothetical protein HOH36_02595 [Acidimicrobiaceae bacterium]|jgi:hypothetical protein|nr:hypothetical protein [Acidimicrobiaceae bacterium]MBT5581602.1 hypothetical protein [Acidimicrobiaceae bacterium]MBT5849304.1 hypothetical protein [Acidimicrobiaceae bacterium]
MGVEVQAIDGAVFGGIVTGIESRVNGNGQWTRRLTIFAPKESIRI